MTIYVILILPFLAHLFHSGTLFLLNLFAVRLLMFSCILQSPIMTISRSAFSPHAALAREGLADRLGGDSMLSYFFDSFEGFFDLLSDFFSLCGVACAVCIVKLIFVRKDC